MKFDKIEFPVDSIVYLVGTMPNSRRYVRFGIVDDNWYSQWYSVVSIHFLEPKPITKYRSALFPDGATIQQVRDQYSYIYRKLPKGWNYDTKLVEEFCDEAEHKALSDALAKVDIKDPASILQAVKEGLLVRQDPIRNDTVAVDITNDGYCLHLAPRGGMWAFHEPTEQDILTSHLYKTYAEAEQEANRINAEFARQAALSDYDYAVEQIDKTLAKYRLIHSCSDRDITSLRAQLLAMKRVENIETKTDCGNFVWRYLGNTRWNTLRPED